MHFQFRPLNVNEINDVKDMFIFTMGLRRWALLPDRGRKPSTRMTRDEQIGLAMKISKPAEPGTTFAYGDINYLLLTEIIESRTVKEFCRPISELLELKNLNSKPPGSLPLRANPPRHCNSPLSIPAPTIGISFGLDSFWDLYGDGDFLPISKILPCSFRPVWR